MQDAIKFIKEINEQLWFHITKFFIFLLCFEFWSLAMAVKLLSSCLQCFLVLLHLLPKCAAGQVSLALGLQVSVNPAKILQDLEDLASFSDAESPAVTRVVFSKADMEARKFVMSLMEDVGLEVRSDPVGNIFGSWEGTDPGLPIILTGSHIDAIPLSGKYDGTVGVIGAIHAVRALKDNGFEPRNTIEVVMFTSEEPTRFGFSCIGSRAISGQLTAEQLADKLDDNGASFLEVAKEAGYGHVTHPGAVIASAWDPWSIGAFVELHIEQGPILDEQGIDIGIVTAIAAPATIKTTFSGDGGHAGALLMHNRNDAGLAAAELALFVEKAVLATGVVDTVGTTGRIDLEPNAVNSVPREARLEIDVRDIDLNRRDGVVEKIVAAATEIATRRRLRHTVDIVNQDPPATSSPEVALALQDATRALGLQSIPMVSRAYHDALFMGRIAPTGMLFIPCRKGVSHRPDEYTSEDNIAKGVEVLALTIANVTVQAPKERAKHKHSKDVCEHAI